MPGTNAGTGYDLTFRCAKCRRSNAYSAVSGYKTQIGLRYVATGRTKKKPHGVGRIRSAPFLAEYRCLDCGHIGWSSHGDMERALRRRNKP